jgi:hypothetical protein
LVAPPITADAHIHSSSLHISLGEPQPSAVEYCVIPNTDIDRPGDGFQDFFDWDRYYGVDARLVTEEIAHYDTVTGLDGPASGRADTKILYPGDASQNPFNFNFNATPISEELVQGAPVNGLDGPAPERAVFADGNLAVNLPSSTPAPGPVAPLLISHVPPPASSRYQCSNCTKSYTRRGELVRHQRIHNPNAPRYPCPYTGCDRIGTRGFLRSDKLIEHRRHRGH